MPSVILPLVRCSCVRQQYCAVLCETAVLSSAVVRQQYCAVLCGAAVLSVLCKAAVLSLLQV